MALLEVENLHVEFGAFKAVDGVGLTLDAGEVLGIVGESGSGKSVTALALMGLIDEPGRVRAQRLMFDTVLPNCAAPLIVQATLGFSTAILDAAALGFLGLGAQPPTPEWGSMLASALEFIQSAWWVVTLPGLAILVSVLAFNLMGDGLRDALDPKLKR